jgi:hypothetical protein
MTHILDIRDIKHYLKLTFRIHLIFVVNNVKAQVEITVSIFISTTPLLGHIVLKLNGVSPNKMY